MPTLYYGAGGNGLDGEGRYTQITASSGTNPVTGVTYSTSSTTNSLGALIGVTYGSSDSDSFSYDPNTGRPTQYVFSVNGATDTGTPTWNSNGTLASLGISDNISGTGDSQIAALPMTICGDRQALTVALPGNNRSATMPSAISTRAAACHFKRPTRRTRTSSA